MVLVLASSQMKTAMFTTAPLSLSLFLSFSLSLFLSFSHLSLLTRRRRWQQPLAAAAGLTLSGIPNG
jgi:hypothetical protein